MKSDKTFNNWKDKIILEKYGKIVAMTKKTNQMGKKYQNTLKL
jgi:hypothetical protein